MPKPTRREKLIAIYAKALKGRAVYIQSAFGNPSVSRIGFETDPELYHNNTFWFSKPSHAELVMLRCKDDFEAIGAMRLHGWVDLGVSDVREKIDAVARLLGAKWQTRDQIYTGAGIVADEIVSRLEDMRKDGRLAEVNRGYKVYRLDQEEKGATVVPYPAYVEKYVESLVAATALELFPNS